MSPLIKTPRTTVSPNLVCFPKSPFKCKGFWEGNHIPPWEGPAEFSPVSSSEMRLPKVLPPSSGWLRQMLLWSPPHQRPQLEIYSSPSNSINPERWACFSLQTWCWQQNILLRAEECIWNGRLFNPTRVPSYSHLMQGEREKAEALRKHISCLCRRLTGSKGFTVSTATHPQGGWQGLPLVA